MNVGRFTRFVARSVAGTLVAGLVLASQSSVPTYAAATTSATSCASATEDTVSKLKVAPSHGNVFYIDSGVTPKIDAAYIGYRVTNTDTASDRAGLWVQVSSFTGGSVSLANSADATQTLSTVAKNGGSSTSFFLLKASASTTTDQTHLVKVFDRRPDLTGATTLYQCTFTFTDVLETIKAAANKVDSVVGTSGSLSLGQKYLVTVDGQMGQIGQGNAQDGDIIWLSPSALSSWPTRSLRLESTSLILDQDGNFTSTTSDQATYTDQLLVKGANTLKPGTSNNKLGPASRYRAVYTYRVIGSAASSPKVMPIAQIASGTQIKHTDTSGTTSGAFPTVNLTSVTSTLTASKSATAATGTGATDLGQNIGGTSGVTYAKVNYQVTVASTGDAAVDEIVDTPPASTFYVAGSGLVTDTTATNKAIAPTLSSSETSLNPAPRHFIGPFTASAARTVLLNYSLWVPLTSGTYQNSVYAKSGDQIVGASASATAGVAVVTNGNSVQSTSTSNIGLPPIATTLAPLSVGATSATIAGQVDANSTTTQVSFNWGTASNALTNSISIGTATSDATAPFSSDLSGLTSETTYYYEIVGTYSGSTVVKGGVQSFTTPKQGSTAQTITFNALSNVLLSATSPTVVTNLNTTGDAYTTGGVFSTSGLLVSLASNSPTICSVDGGLSDASGNVIYTVSLLTVGTCSLTASQQGSPTYAVASPVTRTFTISSTPTVITNTATQVDSRSATLNGSVAWGGSAATTSFCYGIDSGLANCTSAAGSPLTISADGSTNISAAVASLQPGTTYYFRAIATNASGTTNGAINSFVTSKIPQTVSFTTSAPTSASVGGSTYLVQGTASSGLQPIITSGSPSVCTVTNGEVTFISAGICVLNINQVGNSSYLPATQVQQTFSVDGASRTLVLPTYAEPFIWSDVAPTPIATASADDFDPKSYSTVDANDASDTSVCEYQNGVLVFKKPGDCWVKGTVQQGNRYKSVSNKTKIVVTKRNQVLTLNGATESVLTGSKTINAQSNANTSNSAMGTTSYELDPQRTSQPGCSVDANTGAVSFTQAGFCYVKASKRGNDWWTDATSTATITVTRAQRTLDLQSTAQNGVAWGTLGKTISSQALDGLASADDSDQKEFMTVDANGNSSTAVCSLLNGELTFHHAGDCWIKGTIYQGNRYNQAINQLKIVVSKRDQTVEMSNETDFVAAGRKAVSATSDADTNSAGITTSYELDPGFTSAPGCAVDSTTGVVSFTSAGTCYVKAIKRGNGDWFDGSARATVTVSRGNRSLSLSTTGQDFDVWGTPNRIAVAQASEDDSDAKTFVSSNEDVCSIDATGRLTLKKPGLCSLVSNVGESNRFNSAQSNRVEFTIGRKAQEFHSIGDVAVGISSASTSLASSADSESEHSDLAVTEYSVSTDVSDLNDANCTVDATTGLVQFSHEGECSIVLSNPGNSFWKPVTVKRKVIVNSKRTRHLRMADQNVTAIEASKSVIAEGDIDDPASATYELDPSFTDENGETGCAINATTGEVTFEQAGVCYLRAKKPSDVTWNAASVTARVLISRVDRTLELSTDAQNGVAWGTQGKTVTGHAKRGLNLADDADAKTYVAVNENGEPSTNVCEFRNGSLSFIEPGDCWIRGTVIQGRKYNSATTRIKIVVGKRSRPLTMNDVSASIADGSKSVTAVTSDSEDTEPARYELDSSHSSANQLAGCSVDSATGLVNFSSPGSCYVKASKPANDKWESTSSFAVVRIAAEVVQQKNHRTIKPVRLGGNRLPARPGTTGVISHELSAGTGNVTVEAGPSTVCEITSDSEISYLGVGTCNVRDSVAEDANYYSANGSLSITVAKRTQILNLKSSLQNVPLGDSAILTVQGSSGSGSITYRVTAGVKNCKVSGSTLTGTAIGKCKVRATIDADAIYSAATSNEVEIVVSESVVATPTPTPQVLETNPVTPVPSFSPTPSEIPSPLPSTSRLPVSPSAQPTPSARALPVPSASTIQVGGNDQGLEATDTINIDGRVVPAREATSSNGIASRSVDALANETLGGFAPGVGLTIEVIGARTSGQFVVAPGASADPIAIAAALEESSARTMSNFAQVKNAVSIPTPNANEIIGGQITENARSVFEASGLASPITVGQLNTNASTKWIKIEAAVSTYKPGTVVYLAVTTQPVIFGAAVVDRFGKAEFSGVLPVDALASGGHNIRIVGLRELKGVSTNQSGEVVLSTSTMDEIQKFDQGTKSTVRVIGANNTGGKNLVVRVIPLLKIKPWWTLWLMMWTVLILFIGRRYRKIQSRREKLTTRVLIIVAALPGLVLGWTSASYDVMGAVTATALIGWFGVTRLPMKRVAESDFDETLSEA